jgi:hypothetical protein
MQRQNKKGRSYVPVGNYDNKVISGIKSEIVATIKTYNDRKSSKEKTMDDLQIILDKIEKKINFSFITN